jgi:hypothetical protein
MINFDYDKLIILKYLTGGGGVFLQACLGLSDDAVFKQKNLTQMQLDGKLPIEKKLKYLLLATKEQSEKQIWDDWGFRGGIKGKFWIVKGHDYLLCEKEDISRKFAPIVGKCIDNNKFMFLTANYDRILISMLKYWKNSKVIIFKNEQKFASKRTLGRFDTTLETGLHSMTKLQLDQSKLNNLSYEWDCDWYYSRDKTVDEIKKLYDSFGLSGFNAEMISEFYEAWINAIKL